MSLKVVQPFSHHEEKIDLYQFNIYIFSFNVAPIQGKNSFISQSCKPLYLMTVPVFVLPGITSNMYFVHVDLMNSGLYLLCLRLELSDYLSKSV